MTQQEDIERAVDAMRRGGVIVYPTDTVWGIGCDARCSEAVRRVFEIKRRADSKALITLVDSELMLARHTACCQLPAIAAESGRPVTVVYPKGIGVAPELLAEDGSIGVRLTRESISAGLCGALGAPLVSTSANISGEPTPTCFDQIDAEILSEVDYVMASRRDDCTATQPSMVVKLMADGNIIILRP